MNRIVKEKNGQIIVLEFSPVIGCEVNTWFCGQMIERYYHFAYETDVDKIVEDFYSKLNIVEIEI